LILQWLGIIAAIVVVDLALSGDNALVIGAVASRLKQPQRRFAIIFGGVMAVVLRMLLAGVALFLLRVPYIQAAGGLVVLYIAVQLISERHDSGHDDAKPEKRFRAQDSLLWASVTILFADVSMSLDNVLAVAALAQRAGGNGDFLLLSIGILFSMVLLLVASTVIATLIERFPLLLYLASGILAWTAGSMVLNDNGLKPYIQALDNQVPGPPLVWFVPPFFLVLAFIAWLVVRAVQHQRHRDPRHGDV
jgi:YjbE family integral membrane protein